MKTEKISIILPVYNRRHLISRAVRSVQNQSYENWQLIIIDDGSTDAVENDIEPLTRADSRVCFLRQERAGPAASRNRGIKRAEGKYITFIDSDDEYRKEHLQLRLEYMLEHPQVDVIHGGAELVGPEETHWVRDARNPQKWIHLSECYMAATLFGKCSVFLESGGFRPLSYSAESEFIPRIEKKYRVVEFKTPTYRYYTGISDSICGLKAKETTNQEDHE